VLSGGRLELGIGAGWVKQEYDQAGIPFDPPGVRVGRLEEAIRIIKGLWSGSPVTFAGRHYTITGMEGWPKPLQRPHPPIHIGAGGKRMLTFAARARPTASGLLPRPIPAAASTGSATARPSSPRKSAGCARRPGSASINWKLALLIWGVAVTDDRETAAAGLAAAHGLTAEQVLASPYFLIGGVERLVEGLPGAARTPQYLLLLIPPPAMWRRSRRSWRGWPDGNRSRHIPCRVATGTKEKRIMATFPERPLGEVYTHGYGEPGRRHMSQRTAETNAAFLLPHLRPGMRPASTFGCGPGSITVGLAHYLTARRGWSVWTSAPAQIEAAPRAGRCGGCDQRAVSRSARSTPSPSPTAAFDAAFARSVLEHLADPIAALREVRRVPENRVG